MGIIFQFGVVVLFSFVGVFVSSLFGLPIPGSVVAMVLFFLCLEFGFVKVCMVDRVCDFLCGNMALFFVPLNVGLMVSYRLFADRLLGVFLTVLLSTLVGLLCSYFGVVFVARLLRGKGDGHV